MDTLTHALAGALIGRATAARTGSAETLPIGRRIFVGAVAAAFPDIDFITSYLTPLSYVHHHRGITHSLILLPLWAALLAMLCAAFWGRRPPWRAYYGIAALGIASHIAGDLITSFGTMIFAPFSDARYALSATFIIDLWFSGIILAGLLACLAWRRSRAPAITSLAVLIAYVSFQWALEARAIAFGSDYARAQGLRGARVAAVPRPVSPFNWTVIVNDGELYRYAHVNLFRDTAREADANAGFIARLDAPYRPLKDAVWLEAALFGRGGESALARQAYSQPAFGFFRWFAAYPALLRIDAEASGACAWFHDLRFVTPGRPGTPFQYGMCREPAGAWRAEQLIGSTRVPVY